MKIGIVGAGQVGATAAYSMMMRRVGSEIMLVDRNADLAVAQARDILDATPFADPVRVRAGEDAGVPGCTGCGPLPAARDRRSRRGENLRARSRRWRARRAEAER
jgi:lactate/malate dehydrogenase, NAD binding domain